MQHNENEFSVVVVTVSLAFSAYSAGAKSNPIHRRNAFVDDVLILVSPQFIFNLLDGNMHPKIDFSPAQSRRLEHFSRITRSTRTNAQRRSLSIFAWRTAAKWQSFSTT